MDSPAVLDLPSVLDGAPGGNEGGGESDGAGPPASLGSAQLAESCR